MLQVTTGYPNSQAMNQTKAIYDSGEHMLECEDLIN